jgi:ABC-type multidrug transport system fused ATPase/permease subunit
VISATSDIRPLSYVDVFRLLAFLNITRFPLNLLGQSLKAFNDGQVSISRLNRFFALPVLTVQSKEPAENPSIVLNKATFQWAGELQTSAVAVGQQQGLKSASVEEKLAEQHIYFSIKNVSMTLSNPHELIAIVGSVGSGKSSFLSALLNEMPLSDGHYELHGSVSYCAQTPW